MIDRGNETVSQLIVDDFYYYDILDTPAKDVVILIEDIIHNKNGYYGILKIIPNINCFSIRLSKPNQDMAIWHYHTPSYQKRCQVILPPNGYVDHNFILVECEMEESEI